MFVSAFVIKMSQNNVRMGEKESSGVLTVTSYSYEQTT